MYFGILWCASIIGEVENPEVDYTSFIHCYTYNICMENIYSEH